MTQLHGLLAQEGEIAKVARIILGETDKIFGKPETFIGKLCVYQPLVEGEPGQPETRTEMATTIRRRLDYTAKHVAPFWDTVLKKEEANQRAKADIVINGVVIAKDVPAAFLLGMETRLKELREVLAKIPTLDTKTAWVVDVEADTSGNVFKTQYPVERNRDVRIIVPMVLYPATEKHPAQVEKLDSTRTVGKYIETQTSGAMTSGKKADLLDRLDTLLLAVKSARHIANGVQVQEDLAIGEKLMAYLLDGAVE